MKEIQLKTRREFLRASMVGSAVTWTVPAFLSQTFSQLHAENDKSTQATTGKDGTILVVMQLAGGNDGLNTIVPVTNDFYYKARPVLGIKATTALKLNDEFGLHPALGALKEIYDAGEASIIHGVGYPNPNRSHFRSTEIWHTASDANKSERHGWLGRYFDATCNGSEPTIGVAVSKQTPQAFSGPRPLGVSLESPENYRFASSDTPEEGETASMTEVFKKLNEPMRMDAEPEINPGSTVDMLNGKISTDLSPLDFLERTSMDAQVSSERILAITKGAQNLASYPASQLANSLKLVARMIGGGLPTRVYYVSQGGYDTHTNQLLAHDRLLREFSTSVKAFLEDIKAQGNADRVVVLSFSEFGRRIAENANRGTDHGAAAPMFLFGSKVKPGLSGRFPSLAPADLLNGDPRFTTDFRSVYATVLEKWLRTDSSKVLGRKFSGVDLLRA
jgi:uncharacterized protein (DUF1501 family)